MQKTAKLKEFPIGGLKSGPEVSAEALHALQSALDRYINAREAKISSLVSDRLGIRECVEIQKRHLIKDLARNPLNALWSVPYLSIKKSFDFADKLGWEAARSISPKNSAIVENELPKGCRKADLR